VVDLVQTLNGGRRNMYDPDEGGRLACCLCCYVCAAKWWAWYRRWTMTVATCTSLTFCTLHVFSCRCCQVVDLVQTLDGGRRNMYDPDEIEEEQREREKRNKINQDFNQFVRRVQVRARVRFKAGLGRVLRTLGCCWSLPCMFCLRVDTVCSSSQGLGCKNWFRLLVSNDDAVQVLSGASWWHSAAPAADTHPHIDRHIHSCCAYSRQQPQHSAEPCCHCRCCHHTIVRIISGALGAGLR
jgi:hypothetical protein